MLPICLRAWQTVNGRGNFQGLTGVQTEHAYATLPGGAGDVRPYGSACWPEAFMDVP